MCGRVHSLTHEVFRESPDTFALLFRFDEKAMLGFGLPLSKEGMRLLNKIGGFKLTQGTETSQYLEERTSTETPLVVASESGPGQWQS
jgi:hypothetical protein